MGNKYSNEDCHRWFTGKMQPHEELAFMQHYMGKHPIRSKRRTPENVRAAYSYEDGADDMGLVRDDVVQSVLYHHAPDDYNARYAKQNFQDKVANFVEDWHYPVDEDMHVNAPLKNPSFGNIAGQSLIGGTLGGMAGIIPAALVPGRYSGRVLGSAIALGAGLGAYSGYESNKERKADIANPAAAYDRRRNDFRTRYLPDLQAREHEYIGAIEDNAHDYSQHGYDAAIHGGLGAASMVNAMRRDENGVHVDPYRATLAAQQAHKAYKQTQLAKEQKAEYERRKGMAPEELEAESRAIRERYRALHPDRREHEYERVVFESEPSRLMKRANELVEKSAGILGKMTTAGKVVGAGATLGAAGFTGYHLGRGVDIVSQQQPQKLAANMQEAYGFKGTDFLGKNAPYINAGAGISARAKALIAGASIGAGALGAAALAHKANQEKQAADNDGEGYVAPGYGPLVGGVGGAFGPLGSAIANNMYGNQAAEDAEEQGYKLRGFAGRHPGWTGFGSALAGSIAGNALLGPAGSIAGSIGGSMAANHMIANSAHKKQASDINPMFGFKGKDFLGKNGPYVGKGLGPKSKMGLAAAALAGAGAAGYAGYSNLKGTEPEKVASFLSSAASFIAKNPRSSMAGAGALAGAGIGSATAGEGNRLSGAATGAMGGGALGLAGGNALKSKLNSMPKTMTATQRPTLNMQ